MLTELCGYLKNWFVLEMRYGDFKIVDGVLTYADGKELPIQSGQYFRIIGSIFNDGVYECNWIEPAQDFSTELKNEGFNGSVWTMAVPPEVIKLADDIKAWQDKYGGVDSAMMSPFSSESFGGYSYSKSAGNTADGGNGTSWQSVFGNRLARFRKV